MMVDQFLNRPDRFHVIRIDAIPIRISRRRVGPCRRAPPRKIAIDLPPILPAAADKVNSDGPTNLVGLAALDLPMRMIAYFTGA
jgi:hypothetical protein